MADLLIDSGHILMIGEIIKKTQDGVNEDLKQLVSNQLGDVVGGVESTLKGVVNVAMARLDTEKQDIATQLSNQLDTASAGIKQDIDQAQAALSETTQTLHNQVGELVGQIEDSVIDAGIRIKQPADHILDRLAWNTIAVGAGLILLIGLIITVATFIGAKGWPSGVGGVIAAVLLLIFVLLAAALAFLPAAKELLLKFVDKDTQVPAIPPSPEIFSIDPNPVIVHRTNEINICGVHLNPAGVRPTVTINGMNAVIRGAGDYQITVATPEFPIEGLEQPRTVQLTLTYPDKTTVGFPVRLQRPADAPTYKPAELVLHDSTFDPDQPQMTKDICHASLTITNQGETTSKPFQLTWKPTPGDMQITATVPAIPADSQPHPFIFPTGYTYPTWGDFSTEISSNSTEMGNNRPFVRCPIHVRALDPQDSPLLQMATVIFRSWDDGKNPDTAVSVKILPPLQPGEDPTVWLATKYISMGMSGNGEEYCAGLTTEMDLSSPSTITKAQLSNYLVVITFAVPHGFEKHDTWRFDWSLRLIFSDKPEPITIDFDSEEMTEGREILSRVIPPIC